MPGLQLLVFSAIMAVPAVVFAGPITGTATTEGTSIAETSVSDESPTAVSSTITTSSERETTTRRNSVYDASMLFDGGGVPLLTVSSPIFVSLAPTGTNGPSGGTFAQDSTSLSGPGGGGGGTGNGDLSNVSYIVGGDIVSQVSGTRQVIPEPATLLLIVPGMAIGLVRWRRARQPNRAN